MHAKSGLPANCMPDIANALFVEKVINEQAGRPVVGVFVKITAEGYMLIDHDYSTPEVRNELMAETVIRGLFSCAGRGFEEATVWLPPSVEKSFAPRLRGLGFERSPWQSYTALLK